ncbi:hypothetical protein MANI_023185 [Metarhizium anisopliae]|nr:hypothetical protein MANI_023185 [Metarhizium anisopliae]
MYSADWRLYSKRDRGCASFRRRRQNLHDGSYTQTIERVDFIAAPGYAFVADETADPFIVATDVLSQTEHGPDSPARPNHHVLPTRGAARYTGGLWVGKYRLEDGNLPRGAGSKAKWLAGRAARAEFFKGHARSGYIRAQKYIKHKPSSQ